MITRVRACQRVMWSTVAGMWMEAGPIIEDVAAEWIADMVIVETIDPATTIPASSGPTLLGAEYVLAPRWGGGLDRWAAILEPSGDVGAEEARGLVRDIFRYLSGAA